MPKTSLDPDTLEFRISVLEEKMETIRAFCRYQFGDPFKASTTGTISIGKRLIELDGKRESGEINNSEHSELASKIFTERSTR